MQQSATPDPRAPAGGTAPPSGHLVIGEVVADIVRRPGGEVTVHAGGSPGNVALGLARLGRRVRLVTELGEDEHGHLIAAHLASAGVDVVALAPVGGATATATALLDDGGAATYTFEIGWSLRGVPSLPPTHHFHTGSIAAFLAPGADVLEHLAREARATSTVSFDPNIRPALLGGDRAGVHARVRRLLALADVVKASDEDVAWLHPGEDPVEVARAWLGHGPAVVVVTLGGAGSVAVARSGVVLVPPAAVTVADTVGAGDSYMSALLDGLDAAGLLGVDRRVALRQVTGAVLERVVARASRAAGITVSRPGANPPSADELDGAALVNVPDSDRSDPSIRP